MALLLLYFHHHLEVPITVCEEGLAIPLFLAKQKVYQTSVVFEYISRSKYNQINLFLKTNLTLYGKKKILYSKNNFRLKSLTKWKQFLCGMFCPLGLHIHFN